MMRFSPVRVSNLMALGRSQVSKEKQTEWSL